MARRRCSAGAATATPVIGAVALPGLAGEFPGSSRELVEELRHRRAVLEWKPRRGMDRLVPWVENGFGEIVLEIGRGDTRLSPDAPAALGAPPGGTRGSGRGLLAPRADTRAPSRWRTPRSCEAPGAGSGRQAPGGAGGGWSAGASGRRPTGARPGARGTGGGERAWSSVWCERSSHRGALRSDRKCSTVAFLPV